MAVVLKTAEIGYIKTVIFGAVRSPPNRQNLARIRAISGILERHPITDRFSRLENTPEFNVSRRVRDTVSDTGRKQRLSVLRTTACNMEPSLPTWGVW